MIAIAFFLGCAVGGVGVLIWMRRIMRQLREEMTAEWKREAGSFLTTEDLLAVIKPRQ